MRADGLKLPVVTRSASRCSAGPSIYIKRFLRTIRSFTVCAVRDRIRSCGFKPERPRHNRLSQLKGLRLSKPTARISRRDGPFSNRQSWQAQQQDTAAKVPPTELNGPTLDAPDCSADRDINSGKSSPNSTRINRASCFAGVEFGTALRAAFRPSPHPRIRWTVASPDRAFRAGRSARRPPS